MGDITNNKGNNMIQMTFTNDSGKNIFIICNKLDINAHVERMDEKEFFWTKSEIL